MPEKLPSQEQRPQAQPTNEQWAVEQPVRNKKQRLLHEPEVLCAMGDLSQMMINGRLGTTLRNLTLVSLLDNPVVDQSSFADMSGNQRHDGQTDRVAGL